MIIAGTGSRLLISDTATYNKVLDLLTKKLRKADVTYVISGMAEGFDECIANAAIAAKVPFHAYIPNSGYADYYWRRTSVLNENRLDEFNKLLGAAAEVHYICNSVYSGGQHSNFIRNEAMVNAADMVWVWDPNSPGTKHCLHYVRSQNKPFEVIELHDQAS